MQSQAALFLFNLPRVFDESAASATHADSLATVLLTPSVAQLQRYLLKFGTEALSLTYRLTYFRLHHEARARQAGTTNRLFK